MKAFLLARVSTDDQKDALPAQVFRLTEYAKRRGYDFEIFELRESAYKGNRDNFKTVVDSIRQCAEQSVVVFDKIDRYTRDSSSEEVRTLQNLYRAGTIELHFPSDNLFIHKDSPATDLLRLGMGIVVAQYYSDAISDNENDDSSRNFVTVSGSAWRILAIRMSCCRMVRSGSKLMLLKPRRYAKPLRCTLPATHHIERFVVCGKKTMGWLPVLARWIRCSRIRFTMAKC